MKYLYKYLIYLSLFFLIFFLAKHDLLEVPDIYFPSLLIVSLIFLFTGFIASSIAWQKALKQSDIKASIQEGIAGMGLTIFGKYIPGKIWILLGRAAYTSEKNHYPLGTISLISAKEQVISLWTGLILGAVGLFAIGGLKLKLYGGIILLLLTVVSVFVFSDRVHGGIREGIKMLFHKNIEIPILNFSSTTRLLPWVFLYWLFWSFGFYFFLSSVTVSEIPLSSGLVFPLSTSLGIAAVIAPGGLGIREGIIGVCLKLMGLSLAEAATVAVAARLWFLTGEIFFFIAGVVANKWGSPPCRFSQYE